MSNAGRPRTGMKPCPHCASKDRDSNGQCRCRNVAYRSFRGVPAATAQKAKRFYDSALTASKGNVEKALAATREEFPSLAKAKAPADRKQKATPAKVAKAKAGKKTAAAKADKIIADAKEKAAKEAGVEAEDIEIDPAVLTTTEDKPEPERYVLHVEDGFTDPYPYARKDAAIKNGVRSGEAWKVVYKGKTVAQSDDVI